MFCPIPLSQPRLPVQLQILITSQSDFLQLNSFPSPLVIIHYRHPLEFLKAPNKFHSKMEPIALNSPDLGSLPQYIACYYCKSSMRSTRLTDIMSPLVVVRTCKARNGVVHFLIHEGFKSTTFRIALKLCRLRLDHQKALDRLFRKPLTKIFTNL